jgi:hypothetical protein
MAFTNWLSRSIRNAGTFTSTSVTIPSGNKVTVKLNLLANSDFLTSEKTLIIRVQTSTDKITWVEQTSVQWIGGAPSVKSGIWSASFSGVSNYAGQFVRAVVTQTGSFRWGLQGEII